MTVAPDAGAASPILIRDATPENAAGIAEIANAAILTTTAIWTEHPVTEAERAEWIAARRSAGLPVLVAVASPGTDDGDEAPDGLRVGPGGGVAADRVLGYASYGPFRPHDGYRLTAEHSVYVRDGLRGRGIGRALLREIIDRARRAGLHALVAGIDASNTGSIRLHERLGFVRSGELRQVGAKFGDWLDLSFLVLHLDDAARPAPRVRGIVGAAQHPSVQVPAEHTAE